MILLLKINWSWLSVILHCSVDSASLADYVNGKQFALLERQTDRLTDRQTERERGRGCVRVFFFWGGGGEG